MAYKMKGFSGFKSSPAKQEGPIPKKNIKLQKAESAIRRPVKKAIDDVDTNLEDPIVDEVVNEEEENK